jgi:membrane fusion protein (multidrug efflux system)
MTKKKTNTKFIIIISSLVLLGVTYGTYKYIHSLSHEGMMHRLRKHEPNYTKSIGYVSKVFIKTTIL